MATKLKQVEVDEGCDAARARYGAMSDRDASLSFSYELQGYVADRVGRGAGLNDAVGRVVELLTLLVKANREP